MNYRDTLFFIGKCLTINQEAKNLELISHQLKNDEIDWESVVKISTSHYVFPALYHNLKRANLYSFLPKDLVEYMQHIAQLNGERNQAIIKQVKELKDLLNEHNINPIFIKGVGFLFQDFYPDIEERMMADVDFIISEDNYEKAIDIIENFGYANVDDFKHHSPTFIHHPRIQKEGCPAAVEIHKEVIIDKFSDEFNYEIIQKNAIEVNGIKVLSYDDQLVLSILANQINDHGYYYKNITLKSAYDVYLLSKKTNALQYFSQFKRLKHPLNCFLASCYQVFNEIDSLEYQSTPETEKYLEDFNTYLVEDQKRIKYYKKTQKRLSLVRRKDFIMKTIFQKDFRKWFFNDVKGKIKHKN